MKYFTGKGFSLFSGERSLREMKNLEWIFIVIHSIGVPVSLVMSWLHRPDAFGEMAVIAALLAMCNVIAGVSNYSIKSIPAQQRLSMVTLILLGVFAWSLILYLANDPYTSAYTGFVIVIIEGAWRFGFIGSMVTGLIFVIGFSAATFFYQSELDKEFNVSGYIFWTVIMLLIALAMGLIAEETRRERRRNALLISERTILSERNRIARDLHDTVLKTLHGLSLESYALKKHLPPHNAERAEYMAGICKRSSQEIRDTIFELRGEQESEGIIAQLSTMVKKWGDTAGTSTRFSHFGDDRILSLVTTHNIREVLSEALLNISKHAASSKTSVLVEIRHGEMRMEIKDNGKGIDSWEGDLYAIASDGKFGILGMKERVEQLNGQFSIDSGEGTRLLISIPLLAGGDS